MNDVIISKTASIQRCVKRAREEYAAATDFAHDYTNQDAALLNITRACEQAIDLANHVVRTAKLGIPTDSGESFDLLATAAIIDRDLASNLKRMVAFRNIAVHEYEELDIDIVVSVITTELDRLVTFTEQVVAWNVRS